MGFPSGCRGVRDGLESLLGWMGLYSLFIFFVTDLLQDPYFFVSVLVRVSNSCPRSVLALVLR